MARQLVGTVAAVATSRVWSPPARRPSRPVAARCPSGAARRCPSGPPGERRCHHPGVTEGTTVDLTTTPLPVDTVGLLEGITTTRAIRRYRDEPVPPEALRAM